MIEEQKNEQISEKDEIAFTTDVEKDGKQYFQSLAHQLAGHICKKEYEEFRLTCEYNFCQRRFILSVFCQKAGGFHLQSTMKKNVSGFYYLILTQTE